MLINIYNLICIADLESKIDEASLSILALSTSAYNIILQ
jgi:hypothetical protein